MKIKIRLFATRLGSLPPGAARNTAELEVPDGASVSEVIRFLEMPPESPKLVFINKRRERDLQRVLQPGDELAVFPPMGGG
jgi:molybdopterin synthase sulfur carrier subunit